MRAGSAPTTPRFTSTRRIAGPSEETRIGRSPKPTRPSDSTRIAPRLTSSEAFIGNARKIIREALTDVDQAIRVDPKSSGAHFNRAVARYHLRDFDQALADCDEAIRLDPSAKAQANTIRVAILAGKGELGAAFGEWISHPFPIKVSFDSK